MIFQIKFILQKLRWHTWFKCFINGLEFFKSDFETWFYLLVHFMRIYYEANKAIFGHTFQDTIVAWCFRASRCQMSHF